MSELEDRINAVLNDPAQMNQIAGLARSLMGGEAEAAPPSGDEGGMFGKLGELAKNFMGGGSDGETLPDPAMLGRLSRLMQEGGIGKSREHDLLEAMKPYLSEKRRGKMDRALKIAQMARIARIAMGETGGDGSGL